MRPRPHPRSSHRLLPGGPERGVTLLELLLYMLLSAGLTAAVSQTLINSIRSDSRLLLHQRALALWGRISFLIESEVAEGNEIRLNQSLPNQCGGGNAAFTIMVPAQEVRVTGGITTISMGRVPIHYYNDNQLNLMRCGPPFHADGSLDLSAVPATTPLLPALVGRRVNLQVQNSPDALQQRRAVHYHLTITTPDGEQVLPGVRSAIARTRLADIAP